MASSSLADWKQVQDARFDSHLIGVKKESFYWLTKTIAHNNKLFKVSLLSLSKDSFVIFLGGKTSRISASSFSSSIVICVKIFKH